MIAVFLCIPWVASDAQKQDWGNLKRYAEANKELVRKGKQKDRVVFMGQLHHGRMGGKRCRFL